MRAKHTLQKKVSCLQQVSLIQPGHIRVKSGSDPDYYPGQWVIRVTGTDPVSILMVTSADILKPGSTESAEMYVCNKGIDDVTTEPVSHQGGVEMAEAYDLVMFQTGVDDQSPPTELAESIVAILLNTGR